jgi:lipoprotein NlpD
MTFRRFSSPSRASVALFGAAAILAGCAGRSLNPPQVIDWSSGAQPAAPTAEGVVLYTVRREDTLATIAARFKTTQANLVAWNNLGTPPRIKPDQVLRVSPPVAPSAVDSNPVATTQPVGNDAIEQRSIGTAGSPGAAPSTSGVPLKSGPSGMKRPYSDAALAEMARGDADATAVASASPTLVPPPPPPPAAASVAWAWPTAGKARGGFDEKTKGIDFVGKAGDPVLAAADGKVTFSGTGVRGYGKLVIVQHSPDFLSVYAHNRNNLVQEGATVTKGQKIAEMGNTESDAVVLHFEIRRDSKPVDPLQFLPQR